MVGGRRPKGLLLACRADTLFRRQFDGVYGYSMMSMGTQSVERTPHADKHVSGTSAPLADMQLVVLGGDQRHFAVDVSKINGDSNRISLPFWMREL